MIFLPTIYYTLDLESNEESWANRRARIMACVVEGAGLKEERKQSLGFHAPVTPDEELQNARTIDQIKRAAPALLANALKRGWAKPADPAQARAELAKDAAAVRLRNYHAKVATIGPCIPGRQHHRWDGLICVHCQSTRPALNL